jgi:hypothetical protein
MTWLEALNEYIGLITVLLAFAGWVIYNYVKPKFAKDFGAKSEVAKLEENIKSLAETVAKLNIANDNLVDNLESRRKTVNLRIDNLENDFDGYKKAIRRELDDIHLRMSKNEGQTSADHDLLIEIKTNVAWIMENLKKLLTEKKK